MKISEWIKNLFRRQPPRAEELDARAEAESERGEGGSVRDQVLGDGERARRF